ncbi:MAG: hypothetical protein F2825_03865 [Actinobacteria bacterium]|nr:hypothetical protein [Actinomycetota bacterium]
MSLTPEPWDRPPWDPPQPARGGWPAPVPPPRATLPAAVRVAAGLSLVQAGLAGVLGLLLVVSVLGVVVAPAPLLVAGLLGTGGVLALRGRRAGQLLLLGSQALLGAGALVADVAADDSDAGVPLIPLTSGLVLVLLLLPRSRAAFRRA